LSIDERRDEDVEGEVESLPFVISDFLADQYGKDFVIVLDEYGMPDVSAAKGPCAASAEGCSIC
jgi:hypothetical protein